MGGIATKSSEAASRVNDMAQALGISNQAFQEWDYILGLNGASIDSFGVGMKSLQQKMVGLGEDGKSAQDLFGGLGMSFDKVSQMSPEQAMEAVIKRLQEMPEGAAKADLALQAFGKQGMALMPVLNMTAEETVGLKKTVHDLGMVMSDEAVKAGDDFGDMLDTAKGMVKGLANTMGADLLPSMTAGLEAFIGFVSGAEGAEDKLQTAFDGIVSTITDKIPQFVEKGSQVILALVSGLANALPSLVTGVMTAIPTVASTIIDMLPDIIQAGFEVLTAVVTGIANALPELIPAAVQAIVTIVQGLTDNLPLLLDAALQLITGLAEGLVAAIPVLIKALPNIINSILSFLIGAIPEIINAGIQLLTALVDALPEIINTIVAVLPQIIDNIIAALTEMIPLIIDAGIRLLTALVDALPTIIDAIVAVLPLIINSIITAVLEGLPLIIQAGIDLLIALVQAMPQIITTIVKALPQIITAIADALIGNIDKIIAAGVQLFIALIENLPTIIVEIVKAVPQIISSLVGAFADSVPKIVDVGKNIVRGLWDGITAMGTWIKDKVGGFFGGIIDGVKGVFGIASPSKVFAQIGRFTGEGFINGVNAMSDKIDSAMSDVFGGLDGEVDRRVNFTAGGMPQFGSMAFTGAAGSAGGGRTYQLNINQVAEYPMSPTELALQARQLFEFAALEEVLP